MVKQKKPRPQRQHLSKLGIGPVTDERYRSQLLSFFRWLSVQNFDMFSSVPEIDMVASEYLNHMWQEYEPFSYAGDFISGLIKYVPATKKGLPVTRQYHANWKKDDSQTTRNPFYTKIIQGPAWSLHRFWPGYSCSIVGGRLRWLAAHYRGVDPSPTTDLLPQAAVGSIFGS